jgi:DNA-binding CsgD family transcriptional regulator
VQIRARALAELGSGLRRAGRRAEARAVLAEARELAHRCGARGLEDQVHEELVVAGARPRRIALSGLDALTASERRVADLAAQGMRNRDIAQALFVTLKTVETHLGRIYAKLGIRSRSQLADALAAAGAGAGSGEEL